jgi:transcription elongation factor GreA
MAYLGAVPLSLYQSRRRLLRRSARRFFFIAFVAFTQGNQSMGETSFLTREGYEKLKEELKYLRTVKRPEVAEHIRIAKEDGDLSENAGYDAAKNEQSFVEGRIMTLEGILKNAQIIESSGHRDTVTLGCRITVQEDGYDPETFHLVGSPEADPSKGRISNESPLGQALMGKRVNDVVEVNTPGGVTTFAILRID